MDRSRAHRWSQEVTASSHALDLEAGVFSWQDPARIAESLLRSTEASTRRRGTPFRSAMSMLTFYVNRAGRKLPARQRVVLERARTELRRLHRETRSRPDTPD
ncbi:MAG: DUF3175 domain-containing protein [Betaproteobacteria bacterium]|nr:DUF3175 domain-containing protein [Betaproteobacteria bacterium]